MRKNVLLKCVADSVFQERNISVIQEPKIAQKLKYPRIFFAIVRWIIGKIYAITVMQNLNVRTSKS